MVKNIAAKHSGNQIADLPIKQDFRFKAFYSTYARRCACVISKQTRDLIPLYIQIQKAISNIINK